MVREVCYQIGLFLTIYAPTENGTWDTSTALVRRTLERCIHLGRQHRQSGKKQDEYEAYRLLGTAVRSLFKLTAVKPQHTSSFTLWKTFLRIPTFAS